MEFLNYDDDCQCEWTENSKVFWNSRKLLLHFSSATSCTWKILRSLECSKIVNATKSFLENHKSWNLKPQHLIFQCYAVENMEKSLRGSFAIFSSELLTVKSKNRPNVEKYRRSVKFILRDLMDSSIFDIMNLKEQFVTQVNAVQC